MIPNFGSYCLFIVYAVHVWASSAHAKYDGVEPPLVSLINGTYKGVYNDQYKQEFFLGMPYAQPPVGDLRLRVPQSLNQSWADIRNATDYGPICLGTGQTGEASEDCLRINVIRPAGVESGDDLAVAGKAEDMFNIRKAELID